jgi:aspartate kinase
MRANSCFAKQVIVKSANGGLIVTKFGGTSLADADQFRKVADIVHSDPGRRIVVVSAPGKRSSDDKKITDLLLLCHTLVQQGLNPVFAFDLIRERYMAIAEALGCDGVFELLQDVQERIQGGAEKDWIASRGEYLSAKVMAAFLGATFIEAADYIVFGSDGRFIAEETYSRLGRRIERALHEGSDAKIVLPGFYGADASGRIVCFSRGGSDITGAIVARAAGASVYENWTDVSGLLMADPRLVDSPKSIGEVTYREQRELSYMGASVLHDEAVFPVREAGIPIHIRNTNDPDAPGTRIVTRRDASRSTIVGVAGKTGFTAIFTEKALMNAALGYGRRMLEILEAAGVPYEHAPTSIDSMSVFVRAEDIAGKQEKIVQEIINVLRPDRLEIYPDLALIATVGEGMIQKIGIAGRLFSALGDAGVNIRMIDQGASEINIIVGVAASDFNTAMRAIYNAFED